MALVEHGFDRADLIAMGHAELQWWVQGLEKQNKAKAEAKKKAIAEARRTQKTRRPRR